MLSSGAVIDVVVPVYNEIQCLDVLIERLLKVKKRFETMGFQMCIIFVDDGSKDGSLGRLSNFCSNYSFVKAVSLSRNFGHQIAVTAGLDFAHGDFVAFIDADLQDPPELIPDMLQKAQAGYDVVYGQRRSRRGETYFKRLTAKLFYKLISKLCEIEIPPDTGDFRIITKRVANNIKSMREHHRFIRGLIPWVGFKCAPFLYERDVRFAGVTKYPLRKMIRFAKDAIFSFSNAPLRMASFIGYFIVAVGLLSSVVILYLRLFTNLTVPGITAVILSVIILGGIQIIMLGIIGEYVGRIFEESKNRPLYVIGETINMEQKDENSR